MNAEQFNALYPVGTPVFAYPGFRPEDASDARRLVTRTRTAAQVSPSGAPVVWVEREGAYICLTHVDPVAEDVWEEARSAEKPTEPSSADAPVELDNQRLAEALTAYESHPNLGFACCTAHAVADHVPALLAEIQYLRGQRAADDEEYVQATAERDRYRLAWRSARERAQAYNEGILRHVADRDTWKRWLKEAEARVAELEALKPAPIQTCRVCGAGYSYGEPCSNCEFNARMAAETGGAS